VEYLQTNTKFRRMNCFQIEVYRYETISNRFSTELIAYVTVMVNNTNNGVTDFTGRE
jgi:hypothetical protein